MTGTRPIETYMDDKTLLHLNLQNHDEETLIPDGENLFHIYKKNFWITMWNVIQMKRTHSMGCPFVLSEFNLTT